MKNLLNENMGYKEIFKILTRNNYQFVKLTFNYNCSNGSVETVKNVLKQMPKQRCWLYHPDGKSSISFRPTDSAKEFVKFFKEWSVIKQQ